MKEEMIFEKLLIDTANPDLISAYADLKEAFYNLLIEQNSKAQSSAEPMAQNINDGVVECLKKIRDYFGTHDKTTFEHWAFTFLDNYVKKTTLPAPAVKDDVTNSKEDDWKERFDEAVVKFITDFTPDSYNPDESDAWMTGVNACQEWAKDWIESNLKPINK